MKGCLLCLEIRQDLVGSIQVNSSQWQELGVQNLIEKHFWPMDGLHTSCSWLCTGCWQELNDFHKFYVRVEEAHAELGSSIRNLEHKYVENDQSIIQEDVKPTIENFLINETHFEPHIPLMEAMPLENLIDENKIVIKQEKELEEQNENMIPCKNKLTRHKRIVNYKSDFSIEEDPLRKRMPNKQNGLKKAKISKPRKMKTEKDTEKNLNTKLDSEKLETINIKNDPEPLDTTEEDQDYNANDTDYEHDKDFLAGKEKKSKKSYNANDKYLAENFKIVCSLCQIQAETFHALCKHFKTEHNQIGYVICCKKKFYRRSILVDHVHQHADPNYFKCTLCNKVMADRKCLNMHNKIHNAKEKTLACEICNKKFGLLLSLKLHKMSHLSEDEKHIPCTQCGKKFASKTLLSNHVRSVHLKKYINVCDICGKSIRSKEIFERHMLQHEGKPLPNVSCDVCGLLLANKHGLRQHKLMVHPEGGKKEYTCSVCSKISPNLKAHKKHVQYNHEWGYDHKCTMCEKAFKTAHTLTEHMASHTGNVLYTCPWCPKTFNSNANFHSHRKKAHPKQWEEVTRKKYSGKLPPNYIPPTTNNSTNNCELPLYMQ